VDLRKAVGDGLTVKRRRVMMNNETNELLFENLVSQRAASSVRKARVYAISWTV
jgi:hypothetical protein